MFGSKKIYQLELTVEKLEGELQSKEVKIEELTNFYSNTVDSEMERLKDIITDLEERNKFLMDAKEVARKELEKEYKDRVVTISMEFDTKLDLAETAHANKLKNIEDNLSTEVTNRVNEAVSDIRTENSKLQMERKHEKEMHDIYKKKFEGGKVELGADEIKGMLLSANPNGAKLLETMSGAL